MKRLYFAHPVSDFNTDLEDQLLDRIGYWFPDHYVENPSDSVHTEHYFEWRDERDDVTGMDYYVQEVLPDIDVGVFLPFEEGEYGAGMAAEAEFLAARGKPLYAVDRDGGIREIGLDDIDALSIEETRTRLDALME